MPKNSSGFSCISINNQSTLETIIHRSVFKKMNKLFINIDEILDKNEVDDIIDVHGVVVMRESKIEMKQEDINLSDSTGYIKLTLWEDHIDYVQEQIEQRLGSMIPCQKEFSNKTTRLMRESLKTILLNEFDLVSGFSKYFMCGGCDKKLTDLQTEQKFTM